MEKQMKTKNNLSKIPKILAIGYILIITAFSFDEPLISIGFLIHLIPTVIFAGCLVLAWFKPKMGGALFALAGLGTIIVFNTYREFFVFLVVSIIPIIIGTLFWLSKEKK